MTKFLIIIFIILAGCTWYFWPQEPQDLSKGCRTQRCLNDVEFIKTAYQKQWDEYYKDTEKETVIENEKVRCIKNYLSVKCVNKDNGTTSATIADFPEGFATTSVLFSPKTKLELRSWGGFNNKCETFFCPRTSYDDKVANMRKYFESKK